MTHFRTDDIVKTLQAFNMIRYFGGQHSIYVSPKTLETYYTKAKPNWVIDPEKMNWTPYAQRDHSAAAGGAKGKAKMGAGWQGGASGAS